MIVVLDTTETFHDLRLEGSNFTFLRTYVHYTSSKLIVPRVVFEETVNHFRERLAKGIQEYQDKLRDLNRLLEKSVVDASELIIDEVGELQKFRVHLEKEISFCNGQILELDAVSVTALVERSLKRRKPFDGEGRKGFRDAVLWESVLHSIVGSSTSEIRVALITRNSSDFGKDGVLADDLREDCKKIGKSENCVTLFNCLKSFIDAEVKPHLATLDSISEQIREGAYKEFDVAEFFHEYSDTISRRTEEHVKQCDFGRLTRQLAGSFRSPSLESMENSYSEFEVVDVWGLEEQQVAVAIEFTVPGQLQCLEAREEYYPYDKGYYPDWHEAEYVGDATFKVSMTVILGKETGDLEDYEVNDVEITLGLRWPYPEYG